MTSDNGRYIAAETGISVAINVVISALFMVLVFGRSAWIDLWGPHGLALDFVPQTFMITLMSVLVPTVLTRKRIESGRLSASAPKSSVFLARNLLIRALVIAALLTLVMGGAAVAVLSAVWAGPAAYWHVFYYKLAYGALIALIATPVALRLAFSEPRRM